MMKKRFTLIPICLSLLAIYGCMEPSKTDNTTTKTTKEEILVVEEQPILLDATSKQVEAGKIHSLQYKKTGVMPSIKRAYPSIDNSRDNYIETPSNGVVLVSQQPLSTFSIDVDTGSYANVRSYLNMGQLPPSDAIREEAFINYFPYDYKEPTNKAEPFSVYTEVAPAPWSESRKIIKIGLKGYDIPVSEIKPSNLVFLIDVSGSMNNTNKLPLLKRSLAMLTKKLTKDDSISLVTYASGTKVVLESTTGDNQSKILQSLENLRAGGGTAGESGIQLAYQQAEVGFKRDHINRIILATDGDFNIGTSNIDELKTLIKKKREKGISLTTLGFGRGNYNDALMEQLADVGNGNHAYIDSIHEAQKVLLRQMSGTLQTIASDVKIQVEFNPAAVKEYRLIGYQNRMLKDEDFNNDKVDAGEIGAGHTVTALYEITLTGDKGQIDDLRYANDRDLDKDVHKNEIAQVKVRYKLPQETKSKLITHYIYTSDMLDTFDDASQDFQFATSVAAFAQKLKQNQYLDDYPYADILKIAKKNLGEDEFNYRREFVSLVDVTANL